jgi:hypothetical protein
MNIELIAKETALTKNQKMDRKYQSHVRTNMPVWNT